MKHSGLLNSLGLFFSYCPSDNRCSPGPGSDWLGRHLKYQLKLPCSSPHTFPSSDTTPPRWDSTTQSHPFFEIHYRQTITFLLEMESKTTGGESVTVDAWKKWLTSCGNIAISFWRYIRWWRSLATHSSKVSSDLTYIVKLKEGNHSFTHWKEGFFIKLRWLLTPSLVRLAHIET